MDTGVTKYTHEEWLAKARELFGDDPKQWRFVCPSCGHVQSIADFEALGMEGRQIQNYIGFSCIGRWRPKSVHLGEPDQGEGCNYAGGGLFRLNPVEVDLGEGEVRGTFAFDE